MVNKIRYPKSFDSKKYPKFIRKSPFLKWIKKPFKVFQQIGLPNCKQSLSSINLNNKESSIYCLEKIRDALLSQAKIASILKNNFLNDFYSDLSLLFDEINAALEDQYSIDDSLNDFINNKNQLICPPFIKLKSISTVKDELLFNVLNKLINYGIENKIDISVLQKLKQYSKPIKAVKIFPIKNKSIQVCFSSDGNKGYWDIATMSMRKIKSCMSWKSSHARALIGSLADPYAGIIYITDGSDTKYGKTMLARAVVRFVVSTKNKPTILLEEIYNNIKDDKNIKKIFLSFLQNKTNLPIIYALDDLSGYRIPYSEATEAINEIDYEYGDTETLSYRDSGIEYSKNKKFYNPLKVKLSAKDYVE